MSEPLVHWCSWCSESPSAGTATVEDSDGNVIDLPLCLQCYEDLSKGH